MIFSKTVKKLSCLNIMNWVAPAITQKCMHQIHFSAGHRYNNNNKKSQTLWSLFNPYGAKRIFTEQYNCTASIPKSSKALSLQRGSSASVPGGTSLDTLNEPACAFETSREAAMWKTPAVQQHDTNPALVCLGSPGEPVREMGILRSCVKDSRKQTPAAAPWWGWCTCKTFTCSAGCF